MKKYVKGLVWLLISYALWFVGLLSSEYKKWTAEPMPPYSNYVAFGIETDSTSYVPFEEERYHIYIAYFPYLFEG